jgi:hypothetical protein
MRILGFPIGYVFFFFPYIIVKKIAPPSVARFVIVEYEIILALISAGMLAAIAARFTSLAHFRDQWFYFAVGFLTTIWVLYSNVKETPKLVFELSPEEMFKITAAQIGFIVGFFAYPIFYFQPTILQSVPGMLWLINTIMNVQNG